MLLGGASLALIAAGAGKAFAQPADKLPLIFGHSPIMPATNMIVATQMGFLEQAGLAPQRAVIGTNDIIRSALVSGDLNIVFMATDALVRARAAGFDWKMLYPADIYFRDRADAALMVKAGSPIKTAKDLEGLTIGAAPGTIAGAVLQSFMRSQGADDKSVRLVDIPQPQVLSALESGQIAAAHVVDPFMTIGIQQGIVEVLDFHLDQISTRYLISGYVAQTSWIDANPEVVKRFTDGMKAATDFINANPDKVLPILSEETKIAPENLGLFFPNHYVIDTPIKKAEIQPVIDFLVKNKEIPTEVLLADVVAPAFPLAD